MECYAERKIKGSLAETIVEEMFRELGFYVLRLGQENIVNPMLQLEFFIRKCDGNFRFDRTERSALERMFLSQLPDFVIVNKEGKIRFIEVKFSRTGMLNQKQVTVLLSNPMCFICVVNLEVGESIAYHTGEFVEDEGASKEDMNKDRFHIWFSEGFNEKNGELRTNTISIRSWLKGEFGITDEYIIKKYEDLVIKWLDTSNKNEDSKGN